MNKLLIFIAICIGYIVQAVAIPIDYTAQDVIFKKISSEQDVYVHEFDKQSMYKFGGIQKVKLVKDQGPAGEKFYASVTIEGSQQQFSEGRVFSNNKNIGIIDENNNKEILLANTTPPAQKPLKNVLIKVASLQLCQNTDDDANSTFLNILNNINQAHLSLNQDTQATLSVAVIEPIKTIVVINFRGTAAISRIYMFKFDDTGYNFFAKPIKDITSIGLCNNRN